MAQPVQFVITVDFSDEEANAVAGRASVRTAALDGLFTAIKSTLDQILTNLALIQRDDGALLDGTVLIQTLSSEVLALLSSTAWAVRGAWLTGTVYAKGDLVKQSGIVYVCMTAHTAGVFADDLAADKWGQVTANATAATTSFAPTSKISAVTVQAAIQELDDELRPSIAILNHQLYNGL
ncbi:MAG: hypothetical protein EPO20_14840 [Betaproteobacteria bacterium]|nr:MAG: hypothetical protein EPO20_14840 [Betaproteobacteria bacterium]